MNRFKVGDAIIGTKRGNPHYGITREGFAGFVKRIISDTTISIVSDPEFEEKFGQFEVRSEYFDLDLSRENIPQLFKKGQTIKFLDAESISRMSGNSNMFLGGTIASFAGKEGTVIDYSEMIFKKNLNIPRNNWQIYVDVNGKHLNFLECETVDFYISASKKFRISYRNLKNENITEVVEADSLDAAFEKIKYTQVFYHMETF